MFIVFKNTKYTRVYDGEQRVNCKKCDLRKKKIGSNVACHANAQFCVFVNEKLSYFKKSGKVKEEKNNNQLKLF